MRIPSLFKIPKHQQFEIKPRYYDPVKEFVEERRALAKGEQQAEQSDIPRVSRIRFERRKKTTGLNTSLLQLVIALILTIMIVGWLFLGNDILYYSLVLVPVYLYFRIRKR